MAGDVSHLVAAESQRIFWRVVISLSVPLLLVVLVLSVGFSTRKGGCPENTSCIYGEVFCDELEECTRLVECRRLHNSTETDFSSCRRGWVCCPPAPPAPLSSHKNYPLLPRPGDCGRTKHEKPRKLNRFTYRIFEGREATPGAFPWMALLGLRNSTGIYWACGGSLITSRYVLTAAHCVDDEEIPLNLVRLREHNLDAPDCKGNICLNGDPLDFEIERTVVHEGWNRNRKTMKNDIAMLKLRSRAPIAIDNDVYPVCLPIEKDDVTIVEDMPYDIAGHGMTENTFYDVATFNPVLMTETIYGKSLNECNICIESSEDYCPITESQICGQGYRGVDVCRGDSGGPLLAMTQVAWLVGITSFNSGTGCGYEGIPSIFTNVQAYVKWILDHLEQDAEAPDRTETYVTLLDGMSL